MALLRRPFSSPRLIFGRIFSTDPASPDDEEFRTIEFYKSSEVKNEVKKTKKWNVIASPPRSTRMPVDQHWPSVWPVAASFKPSVVPLPVRQGIPHTHGVVPAKEGNLELMKIPNFLHLTPPAIEAHCKAIKKFCTKWPEALTDERSADWMTISTADYIHAGPSIRDERCRIVTLRVKLSSLKLEKNSREKFLRIVGGRYDPKSAEVVIVTDRCPMRHQNLDFSLYALTAAYHESWRTEEWERTEIEESDMLEFKFENSRSMKYASKYVKDSNNATDERIAEYGEALEQLKNQGDSLYNLNAYKKAACAMMNLKVRQDAHTVS